MGALVTLNLPAESPMYDLPWIITIGPMADDEEWEPVVCGPYERAHALALAEAVVVDEDLMAVVEPVQPYLGVAQIHDEIAAARRVGIEEAALETVGTVATPADEGDEFDELADRPAPPDVTEVRAGFARIAARLTAV